VVQQTVSEADSWSKLKEVIEAAMPGDEILIGHGRYACEGTIAVNSGVKIVGDGEVLLTATGVFSIFSIDVGSNVELENLQLGAVLSEKLREIVPIKGQNTCKGLLYCAGVGNFCISDCIFRAHGFFESCLHMEHSIDVVISGCNFSGAHNGIFANTCRTRITGSVTKDNLSSGIFLLELPPHYRNDGGKLNVQDQQTENNTAVAEIVAGDFERIELARMQSWNPAHRVDRCSFLDNSTNGLVATGCDLFVEDCLAKGSYSGITLFAGLGCFARNSLEENYHGISIGTEADDLPPSFGLIVANKFVGNTFSGILVASSAAIVEDNSIADSGNSGILCTRSEEQEGRRCSNAKITRNHISNSGRGIGVVSSAAEIHGNTCIGNHAVGIDLSKGDGKDAPLSRVCLEGNLCQRSNIGIIARDTLGQLFRNKTLDNSFGGISISRSDSSSTDTDRRLPSDILEVHGNYCFNNKEVGIYSEDPFATITSNFCWNNELGVCFEQGDGNPLEGPKKRILGNYCFLNHLDGISVFDGDSVVENNNCWANQRLGIIVRGTKGDKSKVRVSGNKCHDNGGHGIDVEQVSMQIEGNICWRNGQVGISVADSYHADNVLRKNLTNGNGIEGISVCAMKGRVDGNQSQNNGRHGIFASDIVEDDPSFEISGNTCLENVGGGIVFEKFAGVIRDNFLVKNDVNRPYMIEHVESPVSQVSIENNVDEFDHTQDTLAQSLYKLGGVDVKGGDGILEYLNVPGCPHCYVSYLIHDMNYVPREAPLDGDEVVENESANSLLVRSYQVSSMRSGAAKETVFKGQKKAALVESILIARLLALAKETGPYRPGDLARVGVISPSDDWVEAYIRGLPEMVGETRIREPLVVDYARRNEVRGGANGSWILVDELLEGRNLWVERAKHLLLSPTFLLGLIAIFSALTMIPIGDESRSLIQHLYNTPWSFSWVGMVKAFSLPTLLFALLSFTNLLLPPGLEINLGKLKSLQETVGDFLSINKLNAFDRMLDSEWVQSNLKLRIWRRWVSRKIYGASGVSTIVLLNVEEWNPEDLKRIEYLRSVVQPDVSLMLVIHCCDRFLAQEAFLSHWQELDQSQQENVNGDEGRILVLDSRKGTLDMGVTNEAEEAMDSLAELLGWQPETMVGNLESLIHPDWSANDLAPMLVLGSTPTNNLFLEKLKASDRRQWFSLFVDAIQPFRLIFGDVQLRDEDVTESVVVSLFDNSIKASGVTNRELTHSRLKTNRLLGRSGKRSELASHLVAVWGHPQQSLAYISMLLSCAEYQCLKIIMAAFDNLDDGTLDFKLVQRNLRALEVLSLDQNTLSIDRIDHQLVLEMWERLVDVLTHDRENHHAEVPNVVWVRVVFDFLAAVEARGQATLNPEIDHEILLNGIGPVVHASNQAEPSTPLEIAQCSIGLVFDNLLKIDHALGLLKLERLFASDWHNCPEVLKMSFRDRLAECAQDERSLPAQLASCPDGSTFCDIVANHREIPEWVVYVISTGIRSSRLFFDSTGDGKTVEAFEDLGDRVNQMVGSITAKTSTGEIEDLIGQTDMSIFHANPDFGVKLMGYLEDAETWAKVLDEVASSDRVRTLPPALHGLLYDELSGAISEIESILPINKDQLQKPVNG
jgi:parallel beta helix pectate lyase-like protein